MKFQEIKNAESKIKSRAGRIMQEIERDPKKGIIFLRLLEYVTGFAANQLFKPDGTRVKIRWYDFILNKKLRNFVFDVVKAILDLLK